MKAQAELNIEKAHKLQSDALNRYMVSHEGELDLLNDEIERYRRVITNLFAVIILVVLGASCAVYYYWDKSKSCEKVEIIDLRQPASKNNAYVSTVKHK